MLRDEIVEQRAQFAGFPTRLLSVAGDGPPFALLHGYSDSADCWRPVLRAIAAHGRAAVAVDLPGFGRAGPPQPGPLLPQLDRFVAALARDLGASVLCGNSLGGVACLRAAQDGGPELAGVVPIGPAGFGHQPWVDLLEREPLGKAILARLPPPAWLVRPLVGLAFRRLAVGQPGRVDREAVRLYTGHVSGRDWVARMVAGARPLLSEIRSAYELDRVRVPVLLMWGTRDRLVPARGAQRVLDAVPGARLVLIDGAGHCPQLEEPQRIAALLIAFDGEVRQATHQLTGETT